MTTTSVVLLLLAGAVAYWYLRRYARVEQSRKDAANRATRSDQADLMRKALGTRPPRHDD
jgi:positive regulator of sigma E activity